MNHSKENMIWVHDNFLKEDDINYLLNLNIDNFSHINNIDYEPIMADTAFSYRISNMDLYKPICDKLNELHSMNLNKKYHVLNMQYKKFKKNDFYALHAENSQIYGEWSYILYLTNEIDGRLVFPSMEDAKNAYNHVGKEWSKGFDEMRGQFNMTFSKETISFLPKVNRCIVMKTGIPHYVEVCSGPRLTIAGWPDIASPNKLHPQDVTLSLVPKVTI